MYCHFFIYYKLRITKINQIKCDKNVENNKFNLDYIITFNLLQLVTSKLNNNRYKDFLTDTEN